MVKRILNCTRSDFEAMSSQELFESIKKADGRTLSQQLTVKSPPLVDGISNAEIAVASGADFLFFLFYDPQNPKVVGMVKDSKPWEEATSATINDVKKLVGIPIGAMIRARPKTTSRASIKENAEKLVEQGADFINVLSGSNLEISKAVRKVKDTIKDNCLIIAGNPHQMGVPEEFYKSVLTPDAIKKFVEAGADVIRMPGAGTTPGFSVDYVTELVDVVHDYGKLALTNICTSQEGSDLDTIRRIAVYNKMAGTDIHELSDAGYSMGVTIPEVIMAYSIAIRGRRHTYRRMAWSLTR